MGRGRQLPQFDLAQFTAKENPVKRKPPTPEKPARKRGALNPEAKAAWLAELRAPGVRQAMGILRCNFLFTDEAPAWCCLGLACNAHAKAHPEIAVTQTDPSCYLGESAVLPVEVAQWLGLDLTASAVNVLLFASEKAYKTVTFKPLGLPPLEHGGEKFDSLADANDFGVPFSVIADYIEQHM